MPTATPSWRGSPAPAARPPPPAPASSPSPPTRRSRPPSPGSPPSGSPPSAPPSAYLLAGTLVPHLLDALDALDPAALAQGARVTELEWTRDRLALYLVTDPDLAGGRPLEAVVAAALDAGVGAVQLRDKRASTRTLLSLALRLRALTRARGALLLVDDRLDVALAAGADGVHLGQDDLPAAEARRLLPAGAILGVSVRTAAEARLATGAGADYVAANGVFTTPTKTDLGPPLGLDGLAALRAATSLPLVAIGGVNPGTAEAMTAAGADGLAVVSAILAAADPAVVCRELLAARERGLRLRL